MISRVNCSISCWRSRHLGGKLVPRPSWRWRQWRSVTICRELKHSDQTIKSEHSGTNRRPITALLTCVCIRPTFCARPPPACPGWGEGQKARCHSARPVFLSAAHETRLRRCVFSTKLRIVVHDFARQLFDQLLAITPSRREVSSATVLAMATMAQCHDLPRIKTFRSNN